MDRYITVTSKAQNPSSFVSNFAENIDIPDGFEIALKGIYHPPIFNITNQNNKFEISDTVPVLVVGTRYQLEIPIGFYESNSDILNAINNTLMGSVFTGRRLPVITYKDSGEAISLAFVKKDAAKFVIGPNSPLLRYLGYTIAKQIAKININVSQMDNTLMPGLIYTSCVGNSIIDDQQSRLLAIAPMKSKPGYNFHGFENPNYLPLAVHSLQDITFVITDMDGKEIQFDYSENLPNLPTILLLHARKKV